MNSDEVSGGGHVPTARDWTAANWLINNRHERYPLVGHLANGTYVRRSEAVLPSRSDSRWVGRLIPRHSSLVDVTDTSIPNWLYRTPKLLRVAGYADSASDEAFSRMFERDKNELRDLGIPLETGKVSSFDPVEGYRINRDAYALPAVELTGDEAAAVAVATQLWESPELITATQGALLKLRAAGVDVDADAPVAIASPAGTLGLRGAEDVLGGCLSAIDSGQAVQFRHRPSRTEPYTVRTVEPWGVVTEKGRWYLVGHDRDRGATRTFRLSRIGGEVTPIGPVGAVTRPKDADLREIVADAVGDAPSGVRAQVWVANGRATALRRAGTSLEPRQVSGRDGDIIELDIGTTDRLARDIAGYGADALVLEPSSLREEVLGRLRAHAGDDAERSDEEERRT